MAKFNLSWLAWGSVAVALGVMGLKYLAYLLTGSVALYSDALESLVNVATALAMLWALNVSSRPADADHNFGHYKVEYFSAVLEGVLIIVASLMIFNAAWGAYANPSGMEMTWQGMAVNAIASILNGGWAYVLIRYGRRYKSPALVADGRHLLSDVATSVGVLAGLGLAVATGLPWLDPLLAAVVALHILGSGAKIVHDSLDNLMDRAVDDVTTKRIADVLSATAKGAIEIHDLRTRVAARATFIEFHLIMPGKTTVAKSHELCDALEDALRAVVDGECHIQIHVEPEHEARHKGVLVVR